MKRANLWDGGSNWGEFIIGVGFVDTGEHDIWVRIKMLMNNWVM